MKCVYFDKETEKIIEDNFTKGKWGHKLFSKIIKKHPVIRLRHFYND